MEMRFLGNSGLRVSALSFGTMTFGGGEFFEHMGATQVDEARRLIDLCIDAGVNLFDTADIYSQGKSEEVLGQAIGKRRHDVLIATKAFARMGDGANDVGLSRYHLIRACEDSLRRLGTDYIDLYQVHGFDALTPLEETLRALDDLVRSGKVRYIGCSNYSGWHLMKALGVSECKGLEPYVSQQIYYSLVARESEYELIPLSLDQGVGILVWSPLAFGFLTGKYRRGQSEPEDTRRAKLGDVGTLDLEKGYDIVDVLDEIARDRNVTIPQVALNWLLHQPGISSVIIGARNEQQLKDNLGAASWKLTPDEVKRLNEVSEVPAIYPYWHQQKYGTERIPSIREG
ncbi:aldo/keto reductase [Leptolyngbya sp. FACHB-261]|uniref:aldo/keto reductase n=1 Tax=Leptolyngbya sp. FACHB-261 TaxID=2692806 RepID=UPI001688DD35|nr:aldo/keto reductase [Leptolyngbya sp. FACHB-261]MBD2100985.1 aldo/keto reductase [Leptolyngbya sp. FACHB-261]